MKVDHRATTRLQSLLDSAVTQYIPGISVAVATRDGLAWTGTAGLASVRHAEPVTTSTLFGIGSITKTFIAVVTLQLVEEGLLHLQDTPADLLKATVADIPNAKDATMAQLLNHTSGIPSWEDDPAWIRDGRGATLQVDRIWGKLDALAYIRGHIALASPGEKYLYSNTNYTLLGMVIEAITEGSVVTEIRKRVIDSIGLRDIYLEGFEPLPRDRLASRYHYATPVFRRDAGVNAAFTEPRPELLDVTCSNLSVEWTAGGMVATAPDLALYGVALRDGKQLEQTSLDFMTLWIPTGKDGVQVGHNVYRWTQPQGFAHIGHNGDVLGFTATLYWIEGVDAVVAAMCNLGTMHSGEVPISLNAIVKAREFLKWVVRLTDDRSKTVS